MTNLPYTFNEENNYTYTFSDAWANSENKQLYLYASYNGLSAKLPIWFKKKEEVIEPGEDPIEEANPTGSFPAGESDESFALIYHIDEDMYSTEEDLNTLNDAAVVYMENLNPGTDYSDKKYYGIDDMGIYVLIPKIEGSEITYNNSLYDDNTYKVYVRGWCEIVDINITTGSAVELNMANGYYFNIAGSLYLFINTQLNLVNFSEDYTSYWYKDETQDNEKVFTSKQTYLSGGHYIKYSSYGTPTNLLNSETAMMISGGVFTQIITPSMLTSISNFCSCPNVDTVIISDHLISIGDYAFAGASIYGDVKFSGQSNLISIGKGAFANTNNMNLFNDENGNVVLPSALVSIGEEAFLNSSMGHSAAIDISNCINLQTIGARAFASISNYKSFIYKSSQVEEDSLNGTCLLYLPPKCMSYSLIQGQGNLKEVGERKLSQDPSTEYTEEYYNEVIDIEDSNVSETEKTNGLTYRTFEGAALSGFTWNCIE